MADSFEVVEEMRKNQCELVCVKDRYRFDDSAGADAVIFALSLGAKLGRSAIKFTLPKTGWQGVFAIAIVFDLTAAAIAFFVLRRMKVAIHREAPAEMIG